LGNPIRYALFGIADRLAIQIASDQTSVFPTFGSIDLSPGFEDKGVRNSLKRKHHRQYQDEDRSQLSHIFFVLKGVWRVQLETVRNLARLFFRLNA
jgi:transposase InsO family protein